MVAKKTYLLSSILIIINLIGNCQSDNYDLLSTENIDYENVIVYNIPTDEEIENGTIASEAEPFEIDSSNFISIIYKGEPEEIIVEIEGEKLKF